MWKSLIVCMFGKNLQNHVGFYSAVQTAGKELREKQLCLDMGFLQFLIHRHGPLSRFKTFSQRIINISRKLIASGALREFFLSYLAHVVHRPPMLSRCITVQKGCERRQNYLCSCGKKILMKSPKEGMALHTQTSDMQTTSFPYSFRFWNTPRPMSTMELLNILAPNNLPSADLDHRDWKEGESRVPCFKARE